MKNNEIAELIKKLRTDSGLTQEELAKAMGVTKPAVSQWESGKGIKTINIYMLSKFFDVTMGELCDGKLTSESNDEYIERNYDLSQYYFEGPINDDNIDKLLEFYTHVKMIKIRFIELLPKWVNDTLETKEAKVFNKIKTYYKFDVNYMAYIKNGPGYLAFASSDDEIKFVKEQIKNCECLPKAENLWELSKLYNFNFDLKRDAVCDSRSLEALKAMLEVIDQPEKDAFLNNNFVVTEEKEKSSFLHIITTSRELSFDEIERTPYFKTMLNAGCNCMLKWKGFDTISKDEVLNLLDGKKVEKTINENDCLDNYGKFSNFSGQGELFAIKYWKTYSLKEYQKFIDYAKTDYLKALVNKKDSDPLSYYTELKKYYE